MSATARSGRPSPFRSADRHGVAGSSPVASVVERRTCRRRCCAAPSRGRSRGPRWRGPAGRRGRSPRPRPTGACPRWRGVASVLNVSSPSLRSTLTRSEPWKSAVARSGRPSRSTSATATEDGTVAGRGGGERAERAVAVVAQHGHRVGGADVGRDQVEFPIPVEVRHLHRPSAAPHRLVPCG